MLGTLLGLPGSGEDRWSLGRLSPLIWTRADRGIVIGTVGTIPVNLTTWSLAGANPTGSGPFYTLTALAGSGDHEIRVAPTSAVSGYEEVAALWTPGTSPWLYLRCGTGPTAFFKADGTRGTGSGTGYVHHTMTPQGGGTFLCSLRCIHTAGNAERIGLSDADNVTSWTAAGTETAQVRVVNGFDLGLPTGSTAIVQQRVLDAADPRNAAIKWTQANAANQMLLKRDAAGRWCLSCLSAQFMTADALAAGFSGSYSMVAAIGNVTRGGGSSLRLWSAASNAVQAYVYAAPNTAIADVSAIERRREVGGTTNTAISTPGRTSGVFVQRWDSTEQVHYGKWGADNASAACVPGTLTTNLLTLGALRYAAGPTVTALFSGDIYEFALFLRKVSDVERTRSISELTPEYALAA